MLWLLFPDKEDALESLGTSDDSGLDLSEPVDFSIPIAKLLEGPFPCSWQSVRKRERATRTPSWLFTDSVKH